MCWGVCVSIKTENDEEFCHLQTLMGITCCGWISNWTLTVQHVGFCGTILEKETYTFKNAFQNYYDLLDVLLQQSSFRETYREELEEHFFHQPLSIQQRLSINKVQKKQITQNIWCLGNCSSKPSCSSFSCPAPWHTLQCIISHHSSASYMIF